MPALTETDLQTLRQRLDQREAELRAEVKGARDEEAERPSAQARNQNEDLGEQGEERIRSAVRYAEQERDIEELREIEAARERMEDGSYGTCVDCGKEIPLQRLMAQPAARRDIACQEKYERSHPPAPRFAADL
jgi:RNA polymerase-binding transcription factor DksA